MTTNRTRHAARLLTAALVAAGTLIVLVPSAQADDAKVTPTLESWYQPDPTCAQATGCLTGTPLPVTLPVDVPSNPYPAGTMHIAYSAQTETARSYLTFPFTGVSGQITGAVLDVPLDEAPADGSQLPETAQVQACLATGDLTAVQGSIVAPPSVDCTQHATMTYVATPTPHLRGDLKPLLLGLATTSGIALLPDGEKVTETDAWRVVFSAHDRADAAKTPPAVLTLQMSGGETVSTPVVDEVPEVSAPDLGGSAPAPAIDGGFVAAPSLDGGAIAPSVEAPTVNPPAAVQPEVVPQAATSVTFGYQYPVVWLLPLALLVLAPMAARALTKEMDVPAPVEPTDT